MNRSNETSWLRWLKMGAIGCVGMIALAAVALGILIAVTYRGYEQALEVRTEVDRRFGGPESYRLPERGAIPGERMERFINVRRVLMARCAEVTDLVEAFAGVRSCADRDDPDVGELFGRIAKALRQVPSTGIVFGRYVSDRNRALLKEGMGLGEYSFIYVVSYFGVLGQSPSRVLERSDSLDVFEDRVYPDVARVIERHIAETGMRAGPWVEELSRLRNGRGRIPFRGTAPPELAASIELRRSRLAAVACPAAAELDVTITVRRGIFGYDHR